MNLNLRGGLVAALVGGALLITAFLSPSLAGLIEPAPPNLSLTGKLT